MYVHYYERELMNREIIHRLVLYYVRTKVSLWSNIRCQKMKHGMVGEENIDDEKEE